MQSPSQPHQLYFNPRPMIPTPWYFIAFNQTDDFQERDFCYQATLESGKWSKVRWDHDCPFMDVQKE
jgi:hypothetical protein